MVLAKVNSKNVQRYATNHTKTALNSRSLPSTAITVASIPQIYHSLNRTKNRQIRQKRTARWQRSQTVICLYYFRLHSLFSTCKIPSPQFLSFMSQILHRNSISQSVVLPVGSIGPCWGGCSCLGLSADVSLSGARGDALSGLQLLRKLALKL